MRGAEWLTTPIASRSAENIRSEKEPKVATAVRIIRAQTQFRTLYAYKCQGFEIRIRNGAWD